MNNFYFVSSDIHYNKYAIMCVNSLIENTNTDIVWLQMNYQDHHIQSPKLKYINTNTSDYGYIYDQYFTVRGHQISDRQIFTSARFIEIEKLISSGEYDNICLLDADMLVVSSKMDDVFNLVHNNKHIISANENFKWVITKHYTCDGKPIFENDTRLYNFSCSVPLFFNCKHMKGFCEQFLYYFVHSKQHQPEEQYERDVDDMFIYNIVLHKMGKSKDLFLFPAEVFTQTHMDGYLPWNPIIYNDQKLYIDYQYLEVMSLHGRLIDKSYQDMIIYEVRKRMGQLDYTEDAINTYMFRLKDILRTVENEFRKYDK